ncbi:MAG: alpha/beta fold hydrolase [Bradymonadales bacterium]|nr:alpha/beta fold hydrolase [Bradymonadales bacterium]
MTSTNGSPAAVAPAFFEFGEGGVGARVPAYLHETIETADRWHIGIHRFSPVDRNTEIPVIMLPGLGLNSWIFYGGAGGGTVGSLLQAGREVWLLDFRGVGASIHARGNGRVRIADRLTEDLPAMIAHVQELTDSDQMDMVGHGLGGVYIYLYALIEQNTPIRRAVTISASLRPSPQVLPAAARGRVAREMVGLLGRVPLGRWSGRLLGRLRTRLIPAYFHEPQGQSEVIEAFVDQGLAPVRHTEFAELLSWMSIQDLRALAPVRDRYTGMRRLGFPTRFLVGADDPITPPHLVFEAFDKLGGQERDFVVIGRAHGHGRDYRHVDILLGDEVQQEVSPLVVDWLSRGLMVSGHA